MIQRIVKPLVPLEQDACYNCVFYHQHYELGGCSIYRGHCGETEREGRDPFKPVKPDDLCEKFSRASEPWPQFVFGTTTNEILTRSHEPEILRWNKVRREDEKRVRAERGQ